MATSHAGLPNTYDFRPASNDRQSFFRAFQPVDGRAQTDVNDVQFAQNQREFSAEVFPAAIGGKRQPAKSLNIGRPDIIRNTSLSIIIGEVFYIRFVGMIPQEIAETLANFRRDAFVQKQHETGRRPVRRRWLVEWSRCICRQPAPLVRSHQMLPRLPRFPPQHGLPPTMSTRYDHWVQRLVHRICTRDA
jgi:hypothetical protein